jgi:hypothetical protein
MTFPDNFPVRVTGPCEGLGGIFEYPATLTRDVTWLPTCQDVVIPPRTFSNEWLTITPGDRYTRIIQRAGYAYDGPGDALLEAAPHDAGYQFVADIAAAWVWTEAETLEWFNKLFLWAMATSNAGYDGKPAVAFMARLAYYLAVHEAGQTYHDLKTQGLWPVIAADIGERLSEPAGIHGEREGA